MKKTSILKSFLLCFIVSLCFQNQLEAQSKQSGKEFYRTPYETRNSGSYNKGTSIISLGIGVPNWLYSGHGFTSSLINGRTRHLGLGPIMAKYEYGIRDEVGLGVVLQAATKRWRYESNSVTYTDRAWGTSLAFMGYYHFNKLINVEKLDVYAGVGLNFSFQHLQYDREYYNYYYNYYGYYSTSSDESDFRVLPNVVVAARYYVKPNFALFGEVGYTTFSSLNLGVTFKL